MTVSVLRPRKSIFKSPSSSKVVMVNCVTTVPSAFLERGTNLSTRSLAMSTPAACMLVCLGRPSSFMLMSTRYFMLLSSA